MNNTPKLYTGEQFTDYRGTLTFSNDLDIGEVKRIYFIENETTEVIRAWQGHKIENRWFTVVEGAFLIKLIKIDNWSKPSKKLFQESYHLKGSNFECLFVPKGYATSIQALEGNSKIMVMANFLFGETKDEFRYDQEYFKI
jgi:dTDP-4-dehydrorhamnose 3,5-epimerase-like enzyme